MLNNISFETINVIQDDVICFFLHYLLANNLLNLKINRKIFAE